MTAPLPIAVDCTGMGVSQAVAYGANRLADTGAFPRIAIVSNLSFDLLLFDRDARVVMAPPVPGLRINTATGWLYVVADSRIVDGCAAVYDPISGQQAACTGLPTA